MSTTKAIPVVSGKISGSHDDFPVFIQPSVMTGWGALTLAEAQSIRFYSDEAKTTELAREIVGDGDEIHVKVTSLTTSTTIYADYDGIRADYGVTDTYGRNAVWSDYLAVWAFGEGTGTTVIDSTGNGYAATFVNSPGWTAGNIGGAVELNGTTQRLTVATDSTLLNFPNTVDFTVSVWTRPDNVGLGNRPAFSWHSTGNVNNDLVYYPNDNVLGGSGGILSYWRAMTPNLFLEQSGPGYTNQWVKSTFATRSATSHEAYQNGASVDTNTTTSITRNGATAVTIGAFRTTQFFDGEISRLTIRENAISDNWETTEYNNQNDVATFWGTVTDVGGGPSKKGFMAWL